MFHSLSRSQQSWLLVVSLTAVLSFWMWLTHKDLTHMICSIDTQKWIDATQEISQNKFANATEYDRLPLLPFIAQIFIWNGDIPIDALQSVSRLAWVISVASFVGLLHYRLGIVGSFFGGLILIFAQSYAQLTLEVNAQILLNMFFVLSLVWMNLFPMYPRIFSALLGVTGMLAALSKEQGLLLLPLLFLWVVIQGKRYQKLWRSVILFFLSALPLGIWLYTWLYSMWYRGLKFAELRQDLETLLNAPNWKYAIDQHLNWGKLRVTYDDPQNYWETLLHAWPRLTHDVGNHFVLSIWMILLACGILIYEKYRKEKILQTDWEGLLAGIVLVLPMVPLFAMLLIEPYHLSFLQIPATYFWAWSAVVLYENGRKHFNYWIFVPYIATLVFLLYSYQPFFYAIRGGIGACVAGRTMKVSQWVSQEYGKEQPILFTDAMIEFDHLRNTNHSYITKLDELPKPCDTNAVIATSSWTTGYRELKDPLKGRFWKQVAVLPTISQEEWLVYSPYCPK